MFGLPSDVHVCSTGPLSTAPPGERAYGARVREDPASHNRRRPRRSSIRLALATIESPRPRSGAVAGNRTGKPGAPGVRL